MAKFCTFTHKVFIRTFLREPKLPLITATFSMKADTILYTEIPLFLLTQSIK